MNKCKVFLAVRQRILLLIHVTTTLCCLQIVLGLTKKKMLSLLIVLFNADFDPFTHSTSVVLQLVWVSAVQAINLVQLDKWFLFFPSSQWHLLFTSFIALFIPTVLNLGYFLISSCCHKYSLFRSYIWVIVFTWRKISAQFLHVWMQIYIRCMYYYRLFVCC